MNLTELERRAWYKRDRKRASEWAEDNIYLTKSAKPGRFRNANNPALAGIMDVFSLYHVRTGCLVKGIQTGGTQAVHILVAEEADYSHGNDNALIVMADEKSVKKLSGNRLLPIFTDSPSLKRLISPESDDTTIYSIKLANNFRLDIGWATSEVSVSSESYRVLVLDEIAKYPNVGTIEDMKGRTNTYEETCKRWILSSPDYPGDPIDTEFTNCEIQMDYWPVCPHCDTAQVMSFENFTWPGKEDGSGKPNVIRNKKLARYACSSCGVMWDDYDRNKALLTAMDDGQYRGWRPRQSEHDPRFRSVGMHFPSWCSPFVSLSEIVAKWIEAQSEPKKLKKWHNTLAGVSWKEESGTAIEASKVMKFRSELPRYLIPDDTAELWLVVDTQQNSFYYNVWAAGYAPDVSLHMVQHGIVDSFADLEGLLKRGYENLTGSQYRVCAGLIDSGGTKFGWQKHSRTVEVYEWCSRNRVMVPLKGVHGRTGDLLSYKQIATFPGTNKPVPGGLKRANIRVDLFKDELERRIGKEPDDPGALSFHFDIDESYCKHFTTEIKDEHGDWKHHRNKGRNDYFDLVGYALALREMRKLKIPHKSQNIVQRRILSKGVQ